MNNSNVAVRWVDTALQAVTDAVSGPTIGSRAYGLVSTAMYNAWAAYEPAAVSTELGDILQRPEQENTEANKSEAISYAAYRVLRDLFPSQVGLFTQLMNELGFDPNNTSTDNTQPSGIGNISARALLAARRDDGSNQLNGYTDYTGYQPVNTPDEIIDPNHWQPLRTPLNDPNGKVQKFLTPQWGSVTPFGLDSGKQFRPSGPPKFGSEEYLKQYQEVVDFSANLTDEQKIIAEYWEDGVGTAFPPGTWMQFGKFVSQRDNHTLDQDVQLFFALGNAVFDAGIAAWEAKKFYDSARPITGIEALFAGKKIKAWGGPGKGTVELDGSEFIPYQRQNTPTPPFSEYVSGHSTFSAAAAEILKQFTGSDNFGGSDTIAAGTSFIEPSLTPTQDITLSWPTFTEAANQSGISRLYGGIHIAAGNQDGLALGRKVGDAVWQKGQAFIKGSSEPITLNAAANDLFFLQGSGIPTQLQFTLTNTNATLVNEVGVIVADDDQGTVDGLTPGSQGYLETALNKAKVILTALPDKLAGDNLTRQLTLPTNKHLVFYLVQNGTTEGVLTSAQSQANVFFSLNAANAGEADHLQVSNLGENFFELAWEEELGEDGQVFDDLVLTVQTSKAASLTDFVAARQGEREILDLSLQDGLVKANFVVNRDAAFDNTFGFYQVASINGGIDLDSDGQIDINPGEQDYAKIAVERRVDLNAGLPGGGLLAPFCIADGTPEEFLAKNPANQQGEEPVAYFAYLGANPDGKDHVRMLADNCFGFEDLPGLGDADYNDLVCKVQFT